MEFGEKLQGLRKQKGLTQEELAKALFVSRTAVSKWESGRGLPGIDSLKAMAEFFSVSVDRLLSGDELVAAAESDGQQRRERMLDMVFGLLDCSAVALLFLPLFAQKSAGVIYQVPLVIRSDGEAYIAAGYYTLILLTVGWGAAVLAAQGRQARLWLRLKRPVSAALSAVTALLFIASLEPYAAALVFIVLLVKGILLIKSR